MFLRRPTPDMITRDQALPGRESAVLIDPAPHLVLGTDILAPVAEDQAEIFLAAGCYWGVEEIMWDLLGVVTTSVGFMGGFTPNPTYKEVCTGMTGHTETVRVVYNTGLAGNAAGSDGVVGSADAAGAADATGGDGVVHNPLALILKTFWECHDPTTLNYQGNDVGTQYRSAIFTTTPEQRTLAEESKAAYNAVLAEHGRGAIVTEIVDAAETTGFFPAEESHQQYLIKVPNGYRCHAATGMACPLPGSGPLAGL
nr:peptide-methionine (S)-S-oxide reductase [Trueperella pecoris]